MDKYEQIDISGDVGLRVRGNTIDELFRNAAEGMFDLMTNTAEIAETEKKDLELSSDTYENLLVQWLNELVFLFDTYGFAGTSFSVKISNFTLRASVSGCTFDPEFNESRLMIKAATYHGLTLKQINSHWEATVIFDI